MTPDMSDSGDVLPTPTDAQLREACKTLTGASAGAKDKMASRLAYIAELLTDAGPLPHEPVLLWREQNRKVEQKVIGEALRVGRNTGEGGLSLAEDVHLSRSHFSIRIAGDSGMLEDLNSHNGTRVNMPEAKVHNQVLRDGDCIFAGNHIFVFLDPRKVD
jgi:hypothetical protein